MSESSDKVDSVTLEKFEEVLDCINNFRDVEGFDYDKKYALVIPEDVTALDSGTIKNSGIPSFDVLKAVSSIDTIIADSVMRVGDFNSLGMNVKNFIAPKCEFVSRDAFAGFSNLSLVDLSQIKSVDGIAREAFRNAKGVKVRIPENLKGKFVAKFPDLETEIAPSVESERVSARIIVNSAGIQNKVMDDYFPKVFFDDGVQNFSFLGGISEETEGDKVIKKFSLESISEAPNEGKVQQTVKPVAKVDRFEKRQSNQDPKKRVTWAEGVRGVGAEPAAALGSISEVSNGDNVRKVPGEDIAKTSSDIKKSRRVNNKRPVVRFESSKSKLDGQKPPNKIKMSEQGSSGELKGNRKPLAKVKRLNTKRPTVRKVR